MTVADIEELIKEIDTYQGTENKFLDISAVMKTINDYNLTYLSQVQQYEGYSTEDIRQLPKRSERVRAPPRGPGPGGASAQAEVLATGRFSPGCPPALSGGRAVRLGAPLSLKSSLSPSQLPAPERGRRGLFTLAPKLSPCFSRRTCFLNSPS